MYLPLKASEAKSTNKYGPPQVNCRLLIFFFLMIFQHFLGNAVTNLNSNFSQIHSRKCWKSKVNIRLELDLCRKSCKLKTINMVFCMLTFLTHMLSCYILLSIILVISTIFHRKTLQENIRKIYFLLK